MDNPAPPPPPPAAGPPAGWYHDGSTLRWWDGTAWGPAAPPAAAQAGPDSDDRTFSILSHAGVLVGGFVVPLIFYAISDDQRRPETRWHAREALNFQLTFLAVYVLSFIVFFVGLAFAGAFSATDSDAAAGAGFAISIVLFFVVIFGSLAANFVFSIIGALRANKGIRWKYPVRIPFVRG